MSAMEVPLIPLVPLPRDLKAAAATLGRDEARFLVDLYYQMQGERIGLRNQDRALSDSEEPHATINFFGDQFQGLEKQIAGALDKYSAADPLGQWARSQVGIGPVIAAGLLAHVNMPHLTTAGQLWKYAGLDPTSKWGKGEKRPWNASLKVLCWKIGESFVKFSGKENCYYGKLYRERKQYEVNRNEAVMVVPSSAVRGAEGNSHVVLDGNMHMVYPIAGQWYMGGNAKWAHEALTTRTFKDQGTKKRYEEAKLPDGRIDQRARRWAVKMFLSHYFMVGYEMLHNEKPPVPFAVAHMGHIDIIPPHMP